MDLNREWGAEFSLSLFNLFGSVSALSVLMPFFLSLFLAWKSHSVRISSVETIKNAERRSDEKKVAIKLNGIREWP